MKARPDANNGGLAEASIVARFQRGISTVNKLRVVILKPGKYGIHGHVERFRRGFMPNGTIPYLRSMTPRQIEGCQIETHIIDEYRISEAILKPLCIQRRMPLLTYESDGYAVHPQYSGRWKYISSKFSNTQPENKWPRSALIVIV